MTNRSTRALFHSKTLNTALRAFSFPQDMEVRHQKLGTWIAALKTGTLDEVKKISLHGSRNSPRCLEMARNPLFN
ncbi:hypothetical protein [Microcoleus vaginatus]|uniref:hypothetical protein n=1 Tax=Microcoleus vaginatus TaxID=119532 RepID=UPI001683CA51|nr:hypothetical protein [Microcoleus sp. FACHB-84]MBD2011848.1 hypothetical protein [Microcoleus sp. FACHB-45]